MAPGHWGTTPLHYTWSRRYRGSLSVRYRCDMAPTGPTRQPMEPSNAPTHPPTEPPAKPPATRTTCTICNFSPHQALDPHMPITQARLNQLLTAGENFSSALAYARQTIHQLGQQAYQGQISYPEAFRLIANDLQALPIADSQAILSIERVKFNLTQGKNKVDRARKATLRSHQPPDHQPAPPAQSPPQLPTPSIKPLPPRPSTRAEQLIHQANTEEQSISTIPSLPPNLRAEIEAEAAKAANQAPDTFTQTKGFTK